MSRAFAADLPGVMAHMEVLVGRQPIFDRKMDVGGYELLFRSGPENEARISDASGATANVVMGSLTEIGLERLVGGHPAWVNVPREFVLEGLAEAMPERLTVLELLEDQLIDEPLIDALRELKSRGYRIALDDFIYSPGANGLLPLVDVVKLDVNRLGRDGLLAQVRALRPFRVTLLAEKVETHDEYAFCLAAGCELFQGYFFCKPEVVRDRKIAVSRLAVLQFIAALHDPTVEFSGLTRVIVRDVALSYRLLCYVNSAFFGLRRQVSSITQALVLLGLENLRRWATLSLFASIDGKPRELTVTALIRARFCELAGAGIPETTPGELFTLGLFSVLDALMDADIREVVRATPLPQDMCEALIGREGEKGRLLDCVTLLEAGRADEARKLLPGAISHYLEAMVWAGKAAEPLFAPLAAEAA
jgi:EAL and modified HD-GYP domain-containing signal transduction protein